MPTHTESAPLQASEQALAGIVVLDLSRGFGNYCGKMFANLGADVILVEPLAGLPTRRMGPRIEGCADVESSLVFQYQNTDKRSLALDLDHPQGQEAFRALAARAHLVIESERPGVMQRRGLGYEALRAAAPGLVMASLTPFGQSGPYAQWQAEDIVGLAMGGMLYLGGYIDSPPMAVFGDQAISATNVFASVASMAAVYEAEASGSGQHIDIAMQECVVMGMENAVQFFDLEGTVRKRTAGQQRLAGTGVFECKDGYIYLMAGGIGGNRFWGVTTQWLIDEGVEGAETLTEACWTDQDFLASAAAKQTFTRLFAPFAKRHTKSELQEKGRTRRIPMAPIRDASDLEDNAQLKHREYFVGVPGPDGRELRMPGAPYKLGRTPWTLRSGAPRLGQHTREILLGAGMDAAHVSALLGNGVAR
jgi:crotonobetainyl-CoA:carnitine CoA-transferase CaiB-like acyl-CoA transferase